MPDRHAGRCATIFFEGASGKEARTEPVYNLAPEPGDVAKLGFPVLAASRCAGRRHGAARHLPAEDDVSQHQRRSQTGSRVGHDLGRPAETAHDDWRWNRNERRRQGNFGVSSSNARVPYLSSPTSCSGEEPLPATSPSVSWQEPDARTVRRRPRCSRPLSDCDRLGLESTFTAVPTTTSASAATGLNVELGVHQTNENPEGLAASALKKAVVTLPEGMTVNPSAGAGLGACTREEYEAEELVERPRRRAARSSRSSAPSKSKPRRLNEEATGSVYLATPYANPFPEPARAGEPHTRTGRCSRCMSSRGSRCVA